MISNRAKPIREVIEDVHTSPHLKQLLAEVAVVKKFGESKGLKATKNYEDYVNVGSEAVVWVVSASEPYEFKSKVWNFPIVGSFTYLGYFDKKDAQLFASTLENEGLDTDVRGAGAYSTLGWFKDPILSTMIDRHSSPLSALVNVVLHESTHATFYIEGQSVFNESLAQFVGDELTKEYLDLNAKAELQAYLNEKKQGDHWTKDFHDSYEKLNQVYRSQVSVDEKKRIKETVFEELRSKYKIRRKLTNASLVQFKTYDTSQDRFRALFEKNGKDWSRFWKVMSLLKEHPSKFEKPQQDDLSRVLDAL